MTTQEINRLNIRIAEVKNRTIQPKDDKATIETKKYILGLFPDVQETLHIITYDEQDKPYAGFSESSRTVITNLKNTYEITHKMKIFKIEYFIIDSTDELSVVINEWVIK